MHYYNDNDPKSAAWLRELVKCGHLPEGDVDERSILDVEASDLVGYTQVHFFAGIGGWALALQLAGWPADRPVWTGSPPCQPFSVAGQQLGRDDARHLAPHFLELVVEGRPPVIFGEQVASAAVFGKVAKRAGGEAGCAPEWAWLDDVQAHLEEAHYAFGVTDIPAAGVGAPHLRQRTFFGAYDIRPAAGGLGDPRRECDEPRRGAGNVVRASSEEQGEARQRQRSRNADPGAGATGGLADATGGDAGAERQQRGGQHRQQPQDGGAGGLADTGGTGLQERPISDDGHGAIWRQGEALAEGNLPGGQPPAGPVNGFWRDADWPFCTDGKWRPVEPGTQPLAHGVPGRVGLLRGYGNAIVPQAAAHFILAFEEARHAI